MKECCMDGLVGLGLGCGRWLRLWHYEVIAMQVDCEGMEWNVVAW